MQNRDAIVSKLRSCSSSWRVSSPTKFEEGGTGPRERGPTHADADARQPWLSAPWTSFQPIPSPASMSCRPSEPITIPLPSPLEEKGQGTSTGGRGIKAAPSLTGQNQYQCHLHQAAPLLV